MYDLVIHEPFHERVDNSGALKIRKAGDLVTDEAEVNRLLASHHVHHFVKVPTSRVPVAPKVAEVAQAKAA